jgi:aspartyl-tRNA(Asn)/glutamyl-tRNA(Gln) amidotransferase subunit B
MRIKESSDDYRYFPEPDLPPLRVDPSWLESIRATMPELPAARRDRYVKVLGLAPADAVVIAGDPAVAGVFEGALAAVGDSVPARKVANWVTGEYLRLAKGEGGAAAVEHVDPAELGVLVGFVEGGELSGTNAKEVFALHASSGRPVTEIIAASGFKRISDTGALRTAARSVIDANPAAVADVRAGKVQAIGFLTGQVMKQTRGQADAATVGALLRELLGLG